MLVMAIGGGHLLCRIYAVTDMEITIANMGQQSRRQTALNQILSGFGELLASREIGTQISVDITSIRSDRPLMAVERYAGFPRVCSGPRLFRSIE